MNLLDYTTYEDIRASLGVSDDELADDTLDLALYSTNLALELEDVHAGIPAEFVLVSQMAPVDRSANQSRFMNLTKLFATYAVARQLGAALPLFAPKDITDGKAAVGRFASNPYKDTLKAVENQYAYAKGKLSDAYAAFSASTRTSVASVFMGVSSPSFDTVTGT